MSEVFFPISEILFFAANEKKCFFQRGWCFFNARKCDNENGVFSNAGISKYWQNRKLFFHISKNRQIINEHLHAALVLLCCSCGFAAAALLLFL